MKNVLRKTNLFQSGIARLLTMLTLVLLVSNAFSVHAEQSDDLRVNQHHHFGGDAIYCLDGEYVQTTSFFKRGEGGGFRLTNDVGQELWFVDAEAVLDAIDEAKLLQQIVFIGTGNGTYGPASLHTFVDENLIPHFIFDGIDEHGKPNSMTFRFCEPVRPGGADGDDDAGQPQPSLPVLGPEEESPASEEPDCLCAPGA